MSSPWSDHRDVSAETRRLLERARADLLTGDTDAKQLRAVRSLVRDSWQGALAGRVKADGLPPLDLRGDQLDDYLKGHPLAGALDLIYGLLLPGGTDDTGVIVAVGDEAGRLLWVGGQGRPKPGGRHGLHPRSQLVPRPPSAPPRRARPSR